MITEAERQIRHQKAWGVLATEATPEQIIKWQQMPYGQFTQFLKSRCGKKSDTRPILQFVSKVRKIGYIHTDGKIVVGAKSSNEADIIALDLARRGDSRIEWSQPHISSSTGWQSIISELA